MTPATSPLPFKAMASFRKFTVDEYERLAQARVLTQCDRTELLDGEIVEMTPIGDRHASVVARLTSLFSRHLSNRSIVWAQNPIQLRAVRSMPQSDVVLVRPRADFYSTGKPGADDVLWIAITLCLVNVSFAFMLNPAAAELANATECVGLHCYSTVYAVYNIAYSIGMLATSAIATGAGHIIGFAGALFSVSAVLIVSAFVLVAVNRGGRHVQGT